MKRAIIAIMASTMLTMTAGVALAKDKVIGVSWSNKQEERWKTDEAAIVAAIEANGDKYIQTDAQASAAKQLTDIESLISQGANVLLILAQDAEAILPAVAKAKAEGIQVIAYDRQIEDPGVLYITFDNVGVGRLMAEEMVKVKSEGNFAFIKGDPGDPNSTFLFGGMMEVLKPHIDSGKIKNVCETFTDGWKPDNAQKNMEQCLTSADNKIDAVMSQNDGMAGGVVAALTAQGMQGTVPVTGQDGDHAALNRVALGTQLVSVWKDSRSLGKAAGEAAGALAEGKSLDEVAGGNKFKDGAKGIEMSAILLPPVPVTRANLDVVIDAGWIAKDKACAGADAAAVPACK